MPSEGTALPLTFDSPMPARPCETKTVQKHQSQRRSAEACRAGDGYVREKFCPGPTSMFLKTVALYQTGHFMVSLYYKNFKGCFLKYFLFWI